MINHGLPKSPFFYIIQPPSEELYSARVQPNNPDFIKRIVEGKDPKTGEKWRAELWDLMKLSINEIPNHMCRDIYGINLDELKPLLENRYPSIRHTQKVEILQLKLL